MAHSTRLDQKALTALLAAQHNVIARQQALACGMTRHALHHRLHDGGRWQILLPGVYLALTGAPRQEQREIAALLYAGPLAMVTGPAALRRYGLRALHRDDLQLEAGIVDVLVPARRRRKDISFVRVHRTTTFPERFYIDGVICFVQVARAVADTVRELTSIRDARAVVAEAVQRRFCHVGQLAGELQHGPIRGSALLRHALAEVADGVRSTAEADLHTLLRRSGLPMPMFNPRLYDGQLFLAEPDAWWPRLGVAVEVESREWHLSPEGWERTLERDAEMGKRGIIVLHFTPRQIRTQPRIVIATIREALIAARGRPALSLRAVPAK